MQDQFSKATNVASIITLPDGTPVTEPGTLPIYAVR
ncbi:MAG: PocR ligand-binding domain-containing protein [Spirochaetia bacterium]|nr:PocR ligand-binding domain-containing protein [Spirochaetia bacterium]